MKKLIFSFLLSLLTLPLFASAQVNNGWSVEITPYLWASGIDGDVRVRDREADVDVGFDDLLDVLDFAAEALTVVRYDRLVFYGQFDYFALDTGDIDNTRASLESDTTLAAMAIGYQFETFGPSSTLDVLVGARYAGIENTLDVSGLGSAKDDIDVVDAIFMLRPSFGLSEHWRFNPTLSVGAGDSDLTYELQPQFQYDISKTMSARFGYRRLYYDIDNEHSSMDVTFSGFIVGLGFIF